MGLQVGGGSGGGGGTPGGSDNEVQVKSGASFAGATNVKAFANRVDIGAAVPTAGGVRLGNGTGFAVNFVEADGVGDIIGMFAAASNNLVFGATTNPGSSFLRSGTGLSTFYEADLHTFRNAAGNADRQVIDSTAIYAALPRLGYGAPYGSEGRIILAMADANQTVPSGTYSRRTIQTTGALTVDRTATMPAPTLADNVYYKTWQNDCTGANLIVSIGAGATASIPPGQTVELMFTTGGVRVIGSSPMGSSGDLQVRSGSGTDTKLAAVAFSGANGDLMMRSTAGQLAPAPIQYQIASSPTRLIYGAEKHSFHNDIGSLNEILDIEASASFSRIRNRVPLIHAQPIGGAASDYVESTSTIISGDFSAAATATMYAFSMPDESIANATLEGLQVSANGSNAAKYGKRREVKRDGGTTSAQAEESIYSREDVGGWDMFIDVDDPTDVIRFRHTTDASTGRWGIIATIQVLNASA